MFWVALDVKYLISMLCSPISEGITLCETVILYFLVKQMQFVQNLLGGACLGGSVD